MDMLPVKPERKHSWTTMPSDTGKMWLQLSMTFLPITSPGNSKTIVKPWKAFSAAMKTCRPVACNQWKNSLKICA
jgi:hypothetical protein